MTIEVGSTYNVTFGATTSPVLITEECEWGGWYGTDLDTNGRVRVATLTRIIEKVSTGRQSITVNNSNTSEEDTVPTSTRKTTTTAADRRARRGVSTAKQDDTKTTTKPATTNAKTVKESNTMPAKKISGNAAKTSKPAARRTRSTKPAATVAKTTAAKRKPAAKRTATVKTVDTVTVTLPVLKETPNKVQYGGERGTLITGIYLHKDTVAALAEDSDSYLEATFVTADQQPKHSVRFNEDGNDQAIGSLYLTKDGIAATKLAVKDNDKLTIEAHIEDDNLVVTVTVA